MAAAASPKRADSGARPAAKRNARLHPFIDDVRTDATLFFSCCPVDVLTHMSEFMRTRRVPIDDPAALVEWASATLPDVNYYIGVGVDPDGNFAVPNADNSLVHFYCARTGAFIRNLKLSSNKLTRRSDASCCLFGPDGTLYTPRLSVHAVAVYSAEGQFKRLIDEQCCHGVGQMALHPTKPLLAVSSTYGHMGYRVYDLDGGGGKHPIEGWNERTYDQRGSVPYPLAYLSTGKLVIQKMGRLFMTDEWMEHGIQFGPEHVTAHQIAVDQDDNVYVPDYVRHNVHVYSTRTLQRVCILGENSGAPLENPHSVAISFLGSVGVIDRLYSGGVKLRIFRVP